MTSTPLSVRDQEKGRHLPPVVLVRLRPAGGIEAAYPSETVEEGQQEDFHRIEGPVVDV